jgi:hypothetical protein
MGVVLRVTVKVARGTAQDANGASRKGADPKGADPNGAGPNCATPEGRNGAEPERRNAWAQVQVRGSRM